MKMTQLYVFAAAVSVAVASVTLAFIVNVAMQPITTALTSVA